MEIRYSTSYQDSILGSFPRFSKSNVFWDYLGRFYRGIQIGFSLLVMQSITNGIRHLSSHLKCYDYVTKEDVPWHRWLWLCKHVRRHCVELVLDLFKSIRRLSWILLLISRTESDWSFYIQVVARSKPYKVLTLDQRQSGLTQQHPTWVLDVFFHLWAVSLLSQRGCQ